MISCKEYTEKRKQELKEEIIKLKVENEYTFEPNLTVIQIGDNPASNSYIKGKFNDCNEVGIYCNHLKFNEGIEESEILDLIDELNKDDSIHGVIVQLPLPEKFNADLITSHISPEKDVDGFRKDSLFNPCTPKGIIDWLDYNNYDFEGKVVTVVGRSNIVGKPLVNMLIDKGATVINCNSKTKDLRRHTYISDMVISAIGKPKYFSFLDFGLHCKVVVDVGINRDADGKLCGDVNSNYFTTCKPETYCTPVPSGVGLLTRCRLLENVIEAWKLLEKSE